MRTLGIAGAYAVAVPLLTIVNADFLRHDVIRLVELAGISVLLSLLYLYTAIVLIAFLAVARPSDDGQPAPIRERFGVLGSAAGLAIAVLCAMGLFSLFWKAGFYLRLPLPSMTGSVIRSLGLVSRAAALIAILGLVALIIRDLRRKAIRVA